MNNDRFVGFRFDCAFAPTARMNVIVSNHLRLAFIRYFLRWRCFCRSVQGDGLMLSDGIESQGISL